MTEELRCTIKKHIRWRASPLLSHYAWALPHLFIQVEVRTNLGDFHGKTCYSTLLTYRKEKKKKKSNLKEKLKIEEFLTSAQLTKTLWLIMLAVSTLAILFIFIFL